jgi:NIMA (never in mitosis gene a)-related kinase
MDYADGGDLGSKIKEQREQGGFLDEATILNWFTQICLAMKHCHDRKILHRDLKAQNIFLTKNGIVKLGDFGIAKVLSSTVEKAVTIVGTPYYLSPEIIQNKPYNFKSDIWSLGVLLYEMCALKPPFNGQNIHQLAMQIVKGSYPALPNSFSYELRGLINKLMMQDPAKRPNINTMLKDRLLTGRIRNFLSNNDFKEEFAHTILHKQNVFEKAQLHQSRKEELEAKLEYKVELKRQ